MTTPTRTIQEILAFIAEIRERGFEDADDAPHNSYAAGWCSCKHCRIGNTMRRAGHGGCSSWLKQWGRWDDRPTRMPTTG